MLRAILNKSWTQHLTKQWLYGHQPPIPKTIKVRWTRYAGHCWRSRDELIIDVLQWTSSHGRAKAWWPAQTYIQQVCADMGCNPEYLPEAMNDREGWQERVRDIHNDDDDILLGHLRGLYTHIYRIIQMGSGWRKTDFRPHSSGRVYMCPWSIETSVSILIVKAWKQSHSSTIKMHTIFYIKYV